MIDYLKIVFNKTNYPLNKCVQGVALGIAAAVARVALQTLLFAPPAVVPLHTFTIGINIIRCCTVPAIEEFIFRKGILSEMMQTAEERNYGLVGKIAAVALSATLFGAIHSIANRNEDLQMRILHVASSTISGIFYGTEFALTGNLWASTITHSLHNLNILRTML